MIDTLKLSIKDYWISKSCGLLVQPSPIDMSTGKSVADFSLWQVKDETIRGSKAYFNGDYFNFSISPRSRRQARATAIVQFSIPKFINGNNYAPVNKQETVAALKSIQRELSDAGIHTNLSKAVVSRVDVFRDIVADESFASYFLVFQRLRGKRMHKREYGTTYNWANTQQAICVYDKLAEMAFQKLDTRSLPANTIRFEHRLLNARKVKATLSEISTVDDLLDGYDVLTESFKHAMYSQLFSHDVEDTEIITVSDLIEDLRRFAEEDKRNWYSNFINICGYYYLSERIEPDTLQKGVFQISKNKKKAWRAACEIQNILMQTMNMKTVAPSRRRLSTLYNELRLKVLN